MNPTRGVTAIVVAAALAAAQPTQAQVAQAAPEGLVTATIGGFAGLLGGAYTTVGVITARSHLRRTYVLELKDMIGLNGIPLIAGPALGVTLGLTDRDRLYRSIAGGVGGMAVGAGTGLLVALIVDGEHETRWAGAIIGGGAGIAIGAIAGALWPEGGDDPDAAAGAQSAAVSLPLLVLRF